MKPRDLQAGLFDDPSQRRSFFGYWLVYSPEEDQWLPGFDADLAAKYSVQGCLVRLHDYDLSDDVMMETHLPPGKRLDDYPEAEPEDPPFSPSDCVWYERAARHAPGAYGNHWARIRAWLQERNTADEVADMIAAWRDELGEWAGLYDLAAADLERKAWQAANPESEPLPF